MNAPRMKWPSRSWLGRSERQVGRPLDPDGADPGRTPRGATRSERTRSRTRPTVGELAWALVRGRFTILGFAALGLALGGAYVLLATPVYQSSILLHAEERTKPWPGLEDLANGSPPPSETQLEALRSRLLLGAVVEQLALDIDAHPRTFPLIGSVVARAYAGSRPARAPPGLDRYAWGGERVRVQRLSVSDDLREAPLVLTALGGEHYKLAADDGTALVTGVANVPASDPGRRVEVLVTELVARPGTEVVVEKLRRPDVVEALRNDLQVAEKGAKTRLFLITLSGPDPVRNASILSSIAATYRQKRAEQAASEAARTLELLESQFPTLAANVDKAEAAMNAYRLETGNVDLTQATMATLERSATVEGELSELEIQMVELRKRYSENHPSLRSLSKKADLLRVERDELQQVLREMPETERVPARLEHDVKVASELYTHLLHKAQELRVAKAGTLSAVRVVDEATIPEHPVSRRRAAILLLGLLLGLGAGVATVLVRNALKDGVDDPHEIEEATALPVYVTIPHSAEQARIARATESSTDGQTPILAEVDPRDAAVEALRSLRTSLQLAVSHSGRNVVAISSPSPGVGKSFVAVNLAHVLAAANSTVVLVDGDLRRGQLHREFGLDRRPGLSDVALGGARLASAVRPTSLERLDLLSSGGIPPNPADLLASSALAPILEQLARSYDLVLVDTPAALAVTDPTLVARHAGVTLLVLRANQHPMREIALAVEHFRQTGASVTGFILNDARTLRGRYGRYGKYHQYEHRSLDQE